MRWIAGIAALVVTALLLQRVSASAALDARATLGLGLLLLAAALGGALAPRLALPRVTGYLLAGLAIGPAWRGYVRGDEVVALRIVLDAGVALLALLLGTELRLELVRRQLVAIVRVAAGTIGGVLLLVAVFVVLLGRWFPLTAHQPFGDRVAMALVLGALAAASSPLAIKAVSDELGGRGALGRLLPSLVAVKDAAVVLVVTLMLAVAALTASRGSLEPIVVVRGLLQFAGSIALGVAIGWMSALYLQVVRGQTPLVLIAVGFVVAYVCRPLELDGLVAGLAAGFVLINYARLEGERVARVLVWAAPSLYGVTFVIFGAGIRLGAVAEVWPWVVALGVVRAFGLHYGLWWAGRDVAVSPTLVRSGWLGLVSQAGVTVGLAALVRRAFPEWGVSLEAFVLGMIGVHEIIGPAMFRWGLVRAGDGLEEAASEATFAVVGVSERNRSIRSL